MAGLWGHEQGGCRIVCPDCLPKDYRTEQGILDQWVFLPFGHLRKAVPRPQFEKTWVDCSLLAGVSP
eukprot:2993174-Rhodomonas_salina.1